MLSLRRPKKKSKQKTKKSTQKKRCKTNLLWQFNAKKNVRWDLIDKMESCSSSVISFRFGKSKWIAKRKQGTIQQIYDNGEYSMTCLDLKPGDIILWGESNWYCTFGIEDIVCMENYLPSAIKPSSCRSRFERIVEPIPQQLSILNPCNVGPDMNHNKSSSDRSVEDEEEEAKIDREWDDNLVYVPCPTFSHFVKRELRDIQHITWAYFTPLDVGDVISGPQPNGQGARWVVSAKWILRRTYKDTNTVTRGDVTIECGQCFKIGENLHYAARFRSSYILVESFTSAEGMIHDIKQINKARRAEELIEFAPEEEEEQNTQIHVDLSADTQEDV